MCIYPHVPFPIDALVARHVVEDVAGLFVQKRGKATKSAQGKKTLQEEREKGTEEEEVEELTGVVEVCMCVCVCEEGKQDVEDTGRKEGDAEEVEEDKEEEPSMVLHTYTCIKPDTMVVHLRNAIPTLTAVLRTQGLAKHACVATHDRGGWVESDHDLIKHVIVVCLIEGDNPRIWTGKDKAPPHPQTQGKTDIHGNHQGRRQINNTISSTGRSSKQLCMCMC